MRRLLTLLGVVALAVGVGAIAYAHLVVAPELRRSVDVLRRAADDAAAAIAALSQTAEAADALRAPGRDVTRRSVAALEPAVVVLDALAEALRAIPGVDGEESEEPRPGQGSADPAQRGGSAAGLSGPSFAPGWIVGEPA